MQLIAQCLGDSLVAVPQDQRTKPANVIDIAIVIGIDQIGVLTSLKEEGIPAYAFEGSNRRIYTTGDMFYCQVVKMPGIFIAHVTGTFCLLLSMNCSLLR